MPVAVPGQDPARSLVLERALDGRLRACVRFCCSPYEAAFPPRGHKSTLAARPEIWEAEGRLEPDPSAPGPQIPAPPGLVVWPWAVSTPMKRDSGPRRPVRAQGAPDDVRCSEE